MPTNITFLRGGRNDNQVSAETKPTVLAKVATHRSVVTAATHETEHNTFVSQHSGTEHVQYDGFLPLISDGFSVFVGCRFSSAWHNRALRDNFFFVFDLPLLVGGEPLFFNSYRLAVSRVKTTICPRKDAHRVKTT